jgi:hypothetical protein
MRDYQCPLIDSCAAATFLQQASTRYAAYLRVGKVKMMPSAR